MSLVDKLTKNKDKFDPNTICGCLNRISGMLTEKTLSEKYNVDPEADEISWMFWKLQEASFWTADELDYSGLQDDYQNADEAIRKAVDLVNGWFAGGDGIIVQNIAFRFAIESKTMAEMGALLAQMKQEFVHAETYLKTINAMNPDNKKEILKIADNLDCVKNKELLMEKYMTSDLPLSYRIIAFACAEGIMFWSSFALIFWLKSQGKFVILADINEFVAKDEGMHRDYACVRYRRMAAKDKPPHEHVIQIVEEFVETELKFAEVISRPLAEKGYSLTPKVLKSFVRFMANNLLIGLGYETHYENAEYPTYMRNISSSQKSNFYEVNVASYQQFSIDNLIQNKENPSNTFNIDQIDDVDF